jgi:hypothetical protein
MPLTIYTEEAKAGEMICPLSFGVQEIRLADGSGLRQGGPWPCCGAKCMAWRWARTHIRTSATEGLVFSENTYGFCGLAGVPDQKL